MFLTFNNFDQYFIKNTPCSIYKKNSKYPYEFVGILMSTIKTTKNNNSNPSDDITSNTHTPHQVTSQENTEDIQRLVEFLIQIFEVPLDLNSLKAIRNLNLGSKNLKTVPKELGCLKSLEVLQLHNNQLTEIPKELGNLEKLENLWLDTNNLIEIPIELGNFKKLETLWLDNNQLTEIPKELGNLKSFKELWLYNNKLTEIPKELGNLRSLDHLNLANNRLRMLPSSFRNLRDTLALLDLTNNPDFLDYGEGMNYGKFSEIEFFLIQ
jgi:Leucine-rich repeat (LRR) protein